MNRFTSILAMLLVFSSVFTAYAENSGGSGQSKSVKKALAASTAFFKKYPQRRNYFFPPGYLPSNAEDEVIVSYAKSNSESEVTRLNPVQDSLVDLGFTISATSNRANLLSVYKIVHSKLPKQLRTKLPPYREVRKLALPDLKKRYLALEQLIHRRFDFILKKLPPAQLLLSPMLVNPIGDCDLEVGAEWAGSDSEISARCNSVNYSRTGLFANVDFPVKNDLTCIKDQGRRGTCAAHATAAVVESRELWRGGPAQNLSEQHIYYTGEVEGDSQISLTQMQTSGLSTGTMLQEYENRGLPFYYERDWNYNRSPLIQPLAANPQTATLYYPQSCTASYTGEECNTYVWQTGATVPLLGLPNPSNPPVGPTVVQRLSSFSYLFADGAGGVMTATALQTAVILVSADVPVVLSMTATDALMNSTDGYVRYSAGDTPRGGHAMAMVGFVDNSHLPAGVTAATERGYFIVKNSWGIGSGDCGFYYLDFGYLRRYMEYISIIEIR